VNEKWEGDKWIFKKFKYSIRTIENDRDLERGGDEMNEKKCMEISEYKSP
jgi:hypothetical protein